jgi:hypothetical protein
MKILDLPQFAKFARRKDVKVLRHKSKEHNYLEMIARGNFKDYQDKQGWDVFSKAKIIISFIAEHDKYARFVGVWKVLRKSHDKDRKLYKYETEEIDGFDDLKKRLIVTWGEGPRSWAQCLHKKGNKEVTEILPRNYDSEFPGYYDVILSFSRLKNIIDNPDSNREWYRMLSAVPGVYLITDTESGQQYVGSAYGKGGIWSRWKNYSKTKHGGNDKMIEMLREHPDRYNKFQFSILRVLESGILEKDVQKHERLVKKKLGTRVFGLN